MRQGEKKKQLAVVKKTCRDACCVGLNMLETLQPASLNASKADGWDEFKMAVGPGASETVVGEEMVVTASMRESEGSRRGVEYKVANGESMSNLGEKVFAAPTEEGASRNIKAHMCSG